MTPSTKDTLKKEIVQRLESEKEIKRIVVFGSFLHAENPNDIDVTVFQDSQKIYLKLALKYRKLIRDVIRKMPVGVIPIKENLSESSFLAEIEAGELIYER